MLKVFLLRKKIDEKQKQLAELREQEAGFSAKEAELESAIEKAETEEEQQAVEDSVEEFETKMNAVKEQIAATESELDALKTKLQELEALQPPAKPPEAPKPESEPQRKAGTKMANRKRFFGMNPQERDAFFANTEVHDFLERVRSMGQEKRAITGASLLIPEVVLDLIKETVLKNSKLYKHVNVKAVPGKARQNIMGAVPEAVWTEMCATLNELSLTFNDVEVDGYKVGGYIKICNAILEDSDINLADEIISAIGQSIGYALDKAILYGTGTKMPLGIVTRLAQTTKPTDYSATARTWENLSTSNLLAVTGKTDAALFKELVLASGNAKSTYSHGEKFWAMNEKTFTTLVANALSINAAGAIVTGMEKTMPVIGGAIETLDFIPDNVIIGGYGDLYLLAERAGTTLAQSEHVRFIEDQTVFKGTARYDGVPVIPEAFVAIGIGGTKPTATMTFAEDKANATK